MADPQFVLDSRRVGFRGEVWNSKRLRKIKRRPRIWIHCTELNFHCNFAAGKFRNLCISEYFWYSWNLVGSGLRKTEFEFNQKTLWKRGCWSQGTEKRRILKKLSVSIAPAHYRRERGQPAACVESFIWNWVKLTTCMYQPHNTHRTGWRCNRSTVHLASKSRLVMERILRYCRKPQVSDLRTMKHLNQLFVPIYSMCCRREICISRILLSEIYLLILVDAIWEPVPSIFNYMEGVLYYCLHISWWKRIEEVSSFCDKHWSVSVKFVKGSSVICPSSYFLIN